MDDPPDLLTLADLRIVANTMLQPYRVHVQIDSIAERTASTGSPFLEAKLADATDSFVWRLFDNNPCFHRLRELPRHAFIELSADWIDTGKYGIEPRQPKLRLLSEDEKQTLLLGDPATAAQQQADWDYLLTQWHSLTDPRLQQLCLLFVERFGERFRRTAAARENHHARRGGLVEHVAQMTRSCRALCSVYPELNQDLLIAGILFHDCGKLWENSYPETGFSQPYHLHGEMLGHIPLGLELVNKLWRDLMDLPEAATWTLLDPASEHVRLHLLHLVASHHGQLEYGSPILPKTPEAVALHHIDNIDAKLEMLRRGYASSKEIAPHIHDRFRPWPTRIVTPLNHFSPPPAAAEPPDTAAT